MKDRRAGVTLLELLIAVSLVGLLSLGMLMAMRVGLDALSRTRQRQADRRRLLVAQRILEMQIEGLMAVVADCRSAPQAPPTRVLFFQGEPLSMRFVTSYSIAEAHRGLPRIVEFHVMPLEHERGVRLIVNERPYAGPDSTGALCLGPDPQGPGLRFVPIEPGPGSFVLADRLARCQFSYQRVNPAGEPPLTWVPRWTDPFLPSAIRVLIEPLDPDERLVPVVSWVVPVRVQKNPLVPYVDN